MVFFFQAEDGIRDLVRSRGLGDVYKRQEAALQRDSFQFFAARRLVQAIEAEHVCCLDVLAPVSYTHLTLPTSDLV